MSRTDIVRFVVYNRRWISLALVLIISYGIFDSLRPGTPVLMSLGNVVEGRAVTELIEVRAAELPDGFTPVTRSELQHLVARVPISAGTILTRNVLDTRHTRDLVTLSLPIEPIAENAFQSGARIHVWALEETHASLVSEMARLVSISTHSMSTIATMQVPLQDEYAVMQATAIRISEVR